MAADSSAIPDRAWTLRLRADYTESRHYSTTGLRHRTQGALALVDSGRNLLRSLAGQADNFRKGNSGRSAQDSTCKTSTLHDRENHQDLP